MELYQYDKKLNIGDVVHISKSTGEAKWRLVLFYGCPALEIYESKAILEGSRAHSEIYSYLTHPEIFKRYNIKMIIKDKIKKEKNDTKYLDKI